MCVTCLFVVVSIIMLLLVVVVLLLLLSSSCCCCLLLVCRNIPGSFQTSRIIIVYIILYMDICNKSDQELLNTIQRDAAHLHVWFSMGTFEPVIFGLLIKF